jgi:hypothetical protein
MRDPHVESLRYRLKTPETTIYENPPAVKKIRKEFEYHLNNGVLTCHMREHYPAVGEARRVVEDFLRSWEIKTALELGRGEMQFQFEDSHVIDRNPTPPGSSEFVYVSASGVVKHTGEAISILRITRRKYPDPPTVFTVTPDVDILWQRYEEYLDRKKDLLSMAYACLTFVERKADGIRKAAAELYLIDYEILDKLGNLTSTKGDAKTARKFPKKGDLIPLSEKENKWIDAVVKVLIRRTGELENIQLIQIQPITMNDLPKI